MWKKVNFEGNGKRVYVARSRPFKDEADPRIDAQIWVVNPGRMNPGWIYDCIAYLFLGDEENQGLLRQINARVRKGGFFSVKPILFNRNGTTYLYRNGLNLVRDWSTMDLGSEDSVAEAGENMIQEAYQTLDAVCRQNNLPPLPAEVLLKAQGFDVMSFLEGREYIVRNKPWHEFSQKFYY